MDSERNEEQLEWEECGAADAEPIHVQFTGEERRTINLCESCLTDFDNAEFVDEVTRVPTENPNSIE